MPVTLVLVPLEVDQVAAAVAVEVTHDEAVVVFGVSPCPGLATVERAVAFSGADVVALDHSGARVERREREIRDAVAVEIGGRDAEILGRLEDLARLAGEPDVGSGRSRAARHELVVIGVDGKVLKADEIGPPVTVQVAYLHRSRDGVGHQRRLLRAAEVEIVDGSANRPDLGTRERRDVHCDVGAAVAVKIARKSYDVLKAGRIASGIDEATVHAREVAVDKAAHLPVRRSQGRFDPHDIGSRCQSLRRDDRLGGFLVVLGLLQPLSRF